MKLGADHTVRLGLEYRNSAAAASRNFAGRVGYEVVSGSLMWDWQITSDLAVTNVLRIDRFALRQSGSLPPGSGVSAADYRGRTLTEPSFNTGLVWRASERDTLRLTAARGLRLPSLFHLGARFSGVYNLQGTTTPYSYEGSPGLRASAVSNLEIGYDRSLPALRSTVHVAVFAQRTEDVLTDAFGVDGTFDGRALRFASANTGRSSAVGGEIGLRGQTTVGAEDGLRWNAGYAYISISDRLSANLYALQDFRRGTPTHVVTLGGGYTRGRFEADVQGRWQSRYRDYRLDPVVLAIRPLDVGSLLQLDARLAYRVADGVTLALTAQRFNVSRLLQSAGPPAERRLFLNATARF